MSQQWYYTQDGAQYGPVDEAEIIRLIQSGSLPPGAPVCPQGGMDWQSARNYSCFQVEIYPAGPAPTPTAQVSAPGYAPVGTPSVPEQPSAVPPAPVPTAPYNPGMPEFRVEQKSAWPWWLSGAIVLVVVGALAFFWSPSRSKISDPVTGEADSEGEADLDLRSNKTVSGDKDETSAPAGWKRYEARHLGFSAMMPAGSAVAADPAPGTIVRAPIDAGLYQVHTIPLPPQESGLAPDVPQQFKIGMMSSFKSKQIRMIDERVTQINGIKVLIVKFSYLEQGLRLRTHIYTFFTRDKVFVCTVIAPDSEPFPQNLEQKFINSFRLMK